MTKMSYESLCNDQITLERKGDFGAQVFSIRAQQNSISPNLEIF